MKGARFDFEGEQLTIAEIRQRVPAIADASIRRHLAHGRNTAAAMLAFNPEPGRRAGSRKAAERARRTGNEPRCMRRAGR